MEDILEAIKHPIMFARWIKVTLRQKRKKNGTMPFGAFMGMFHIRRIVEKATQKS